MVAVMDNKLKLAILEKMYTQLSDICDTIVTTRPPNMSVDTHNKTVQDVAGQREALAWAVLCARKLVDEPNAKEN